MTTQFSFVAYCIILTQILTLFCGSSVMKTLLYIFLLCVLVSAFSGAPKDRDWHRYKELFRKRYKSVAEEKHRYSAWKANRANIHLLREEDPYQNALLFIIHVALLYTVILSSLIFRKRSS